MAGQGYTGAPTPISGLSRMPQVPFMGNSGAPQPGNNQPSALQNSIMQRFGNGATPLGAMPAPQAGTPQPPNANPMGNMPTFSRLFAGTQGMPQAPQLGGFQTMQSNQPLASPMRVGAPAQQPTDTYMYTPPGHSGSGRSNF